MRSAEVCELGPSERLRAIELLRDSIQGPYYRTPGRAEDEVDYFLGGKDCFALAAMVDGALRGWIGGIRSYTHALELHPLVVEESWRRRGIGRLLVAALEARAVAQGFLTMFVGTDDDFGGTSLSGTDVFPDPLRSLSEIRSSEKGHPFFFYRRLGFVPAGIIPDANGCGMPDLFLVKRLA